MWSYGHLYRPIGNFKTPRQRIGIFQQTFVSSNRYTQYQRLLSIINWIRRFTYEQETTSRFDIIHSSIFKMRYIL